MIMKTVCSLAEQSTLLNSSLVTVKIGMVLAVVVPMPIITAETGGSQVRGKPGLVFKKNEATYLPFWTQGRARTKDNTFF